MAWVGSIFLVLGARAGRHRLGAEQQNAGNPILNASSSAGLNAAQLNFSHGDFGDQAKRIKRIRSAAGSQLLGESGFAPD